MIVIWPIHPRTERRLINFGLWEKILNNSKIIVLKPLGYHELLKLNMNARIILTDSGGLQEESTVLGTPCLTLRWNTERPVTLKKFGGASVLVGNNINKIREEYKKTLTYPKNPKRPELWDGKTAKRILQVIIKNS
jgi:UDP-N-acetylglucosamine 2-epimerase (non-hydrolysing)